MTDTFLNKVVTKVVEIEAGYVRMYSGNYSAYALKKAQLRDAQYEGLSEPAARN